MKKEAPLILLKTMMKNSRLSDRELARLMHVSQPTVSRLRGKLEKEGYVRSYTLVPDFAKMGYSIVAFTFSKLKAYPSPKEAMELHRTASEWANKHPNVVFAADGQGLGGKDVVMVSFHRDYDDYTRFIHAYAFDWSHIVSGFETFIVSLNSELTMKHFDLRYLADDEQPSQPPR